MSQREENGSGWRERFEGKEEQSAERFRLAKKNKNVERSEGRRMKEVERADLLRFRKEEKEKEKERSKMTNGIANGLGIKMSGTKLSLWTKWVNFGMSWT